MMGNIPNTVLGGDQRTFPPASLAIHPEDYVQ